MNRSTNLDSPNDFIIVIFPGNVNFLLDHVYIIFSTFCSMSVVFLSYMSKTSGVKVTPNILKGQSSQCQQAFSKPCLVYLISIDTHLVFSIYKSMCIY